MPLGPIDLSAAEVGIFRENKTNSMALDSRAPYMYVIIRYDIGDTRSRVFAINRESL